MDIQSRDRSVSDYQSTQSGCQHKHLERYKTAEEQRSVPSNEVNHAYYVDGDEDCAVSHKSVDFGNTNSFSFSSDEAPEMQVMVNTLTPVLQRRRVVQRSYSCTGACSNGATKSDIEITQPFLEKGPSYTWDTSKKGLHEPGKDKLTLQPLSSLNQTDIRGLFIKPKFAQTWHGPVHASSDRAPRMGTGMVTSHISTTASSVHGGYVHTMPVFSRTLLDALHKRYCSYQYSCNWTLHSTKVQNPQGAFQPLSLPLQQCGIHVQKLGSDGESDTGSSAAGSTQSSPRAAHIQGCTDSTQATQVNRGLQDHSVCQNLSAHGKAALKAEIEAVEACQWLRAAGFPQYAQMFEDGFFPVDVSDVKRDHDFLDGDSIQSLFRRLNILNRCAVMKIDTQPRKKAIEESDEEDLFALSDRWEYQKTVHCWSRKGPEVSLETAIALQPSSSHDSLLADQDSGSHTDDSPVLDSKMPHLSVARNQDQHTVQPVVNPEGQNTRSSSSFPISPKLRRAASERLKSALKKMESFKNKSKKYPAPHNIVEISNPVVADQAGMQAKLEHLHCVDLSPSGNTHVWRTLSERESNPKEDGGKLSKVHYDRELSVSPEAPASPITSPVLPLHSHDNSSTPPQASVSLSEYYTAHSQLLASFQSYSSVTGPVCKNNSDINLKEIFLLPQDHKPGSFPRLLHNGYIDSTTTHPGQHVCTPSKTCFTHGAHARSSMGQPANKWLVSRVSVYDNLPSASSPQVGEVKENVDSSLQASRPAQIVRSLSDTESDHSVGGMHQVTPNMCSDSPSASMSLEQHSMLQFHHSRTPSDGYHTLNSTGTPSDSEGDVQMLVFMDEFDSILQGLYREINDLSHAISHEVTLGDESRTVHSDLTSGYSVSVQTSANFTSQHVDNGLSKVEATEREKKTVSMTESTEQPVLDEENVEEEIIGEVLYNTVDVVLEGVEEGTSHTGSSHSSSDQDDGDFSQDEMLERIEKGARERRDSGVGSSLTRNSSERKQKKLRWHSFQKCHRPSVGSRELQIGGLSVCQLLPLRQLSLLKLTATMEKCSPTTRTQWSWSVPRFMKRNKVPQFTDKNVFGVPLTVMLQRTGQPLPQCVLYAMRYLRRTSHDALGIFRKSGVRSRIQKLRDMVEVCPDSISFDELQPYDVADLLKQYFRELPECLLTNKLADTFCSIFTHVPVTQRLEALQSAVILLPEENLEVLQCLLLFLGDIAQHADKHQMNASNLAVCFAPSLFNLGASHCSGSPRRQRKSPGVPDQHELLEQKAVHECFTYMITNCKNLFMVPPSMYSRLHLSTLSNMEPVHLDEFYAYSGQPGPDYRAFGEENIQILLKEAHDKNRGWAPVTVHVAGIEVMQRKPQDGHPLRQWKCSVEIEAPPIEVLNRILHERHTWDDDLLSWSVLDRLDKNADVFNYVLNSLAPHPPRHFTIIRYWRPDMVKGACAFVSRSVEHSSLRVAAGFDEGVRAVELGCYYLMEPCGSGRSRLTFISRTDLRGRCPEWYNRVYGHLCANFIDRLRDSFRQEADGPETKV